MLYICLHLFGLEIIQAQIGKVILKIVAVYNKLRKHVAC